MGRTLTNHRRFYGTPVLQNTGRVRRQWGLGRTKGYAYVEVLRGKTRGTQDSTGNSNAASAFAIGWGELGRDFWLFRFGQLISVVGDSCGGIALAWWNYRCHRIGGSDGVDHRSGNVRAHFLLPLFGPLGDRFALNGRGLWRHMAQCGHVWDCCIDLRRHLSTTPRDNTLYPECRGGWLFSCAAGSTAPRLVKKDMCKRPCNRDRRSTRSAA